MKDKKCVIISIVIILFLLSSSIVYASVLAMKLYTIDIQNVNSESNVYILLKNENFDGKKEASKYLNESIKKIAKDAVNINIAYRDNNLPKQLEDTNQLVTIEGNDYKKIKVVKNIIIAWSEDYEKEDDDLLIANIINDQIDIIDTSNISIVSYLDSSVKNYGGNSIKRKAMIYDASQNKLTDITQIKVKEEKEKINSINKLNEIKDSISTVLIIFIFITLAVIAGLITEIIVRKLKERKK